MSKKKNKPTFWRFMLMIHGIDEKDYEDFTEAMKKAAEVDYINRYGAPIRWI